MKRHWMPLDIGDFLQDTQHLTATEIGGYMLIIMAYWAKGGPLPNKDAYRRVSRMTARQWSQSGDLVMSFFGDDLRHKRLDHEIAQAVEKSRTNSANAKRRHSGRTQTAEVSPPIGTTQVQVKVEEERTTVLLEGQASERELPARPFVPVERAEAIALGLAFLQALGFADYADAPPPYYSTSEYAAKWLAAGYSREMIIAQAKIVKERNGTAPDTPRYFERVFASAHARDQRPLPVVNVAPPETINVPNPRTDSAGRRATAFATAGQQLLERARRLEQDDAFAGDQGGNRIAGLLQDHG